MKTVIITGGASEIGLKTAIEFAKHNFQIVLTYCENHEKTEKNAIFIKEKYQTEVMSCYCNLREESSIQAMLEQVKTEFSEVDVLVNNAAVCYDCLYCEKEKAKFMDTLEVNVVGTFLISKLVGEEMYQNKNGAIINLSSTNGLTQYYPMSIDYDASKAAILSLTSNLSVAYSPYVRVNCVAPGWIGTEKELKDLDQDYIESETEKISLKRLGRPEEVAKAIYFLASDDASYINNTIIKVDGGMR